ncbi:MAG: V-type ATP synthase subunit I [Synergistaceae bacterium]|jgi:V/A-type H+-transporting ATPase subunit I|nr:V-type ATP synthase subunit I [Synergistaceae bacterium]
MGVAELKKAELYYHKSVRDDVAKILQSSGACQIIEPSGDARWTDVDSLLTACGEQETHIRYLFRSLGNHYTDPISSIDRMLGEKPRLSLKELAQAAQKTDLKELASSVKMAETTLNELRLEISQLKANAGILSRIADFPCSLDVLGNGTRTLKGVMATLTVDQATALAGDLLPWATGTELFTAARNPKDKEVCIVVMYARAHEQKILELCVLNGATFVELPPHISGTVPEESAKITARLAECEREEAEILRGLDRTAEEWMPVVQQASDHWGILHDRYRALAASDATDSVILTRFWIPTEALPGLQKRLELAGSNTALVVSDPTEEDAPPTLLRNVFAVQPFEILTGLYSPPPYGDVDPTPLLAPFFFLFFGMCLGDAGYAIVMMAAIWMLFRKYRRIPQTVKDFILLFAFGAISTLLYGIVSGSFFGDFIDAFPFMAFLRSTKDALMLVDPMKNPMQVLGISLFLGLAHLMFGLAVGAYDHIRRGRYVEAAGDKISWIFFIVGLALYCAGLSGALPSFLSVIALMMAAVGGLVIFWYAGREKKGIFSKLISGFLAIYGSTSYLGDVLSYSRLLALGFGSAVIGMVINLLGGMAAGIPFVGWLIAIVVIVGGHLFGLAINILGAFVHSLRLQYVEFFGKFYGGGGTPFSPLNISARYVEIAESGE